MLGLKLNHVSKRGPSVFHNSHPIANPIRRDTSICTLKWRHNGCDSISNHQQIKAPRRWPLCGEFTGDRWIEFPAQMASNAENASIWWRHHEHIVVQLRHMEPYLGQHWVGWLFIAWRHQTFTLRNINLPPTRPFGIHKKAMFSGLLNISIPRLFVKFAHSNWDLPWAISPWVQCLIYSIRQNNGRFFSTIRFNMMPLFSLHGFSWMYKLYASSYFLCMIYIHCALTSYATEAKHGKHVYIYIYILLCLNTIINFIWWIQVEFVNLQLDTLS